MLEALSVRELQQLLECFDQPAVKGAKKAALVEALKVILVMNLLILSKIYLHYTYFYSILRAFYRWFQH
jgi:hypothetical protein